MINFEEKCCAMEFDKNTMTEIVQVRNDAHSIKECMEFVFGSEYVREMSELELLICVKNAYNDGIMVQSTDGSVNYAHVWDYIVKDISGDIHVMTKEEYKENETSAPDGRLD